MGEVIWGHNRRSWIENARRKKSRSPLRRSRLRSPHSFPARLTKGCAKSHPRRRRALAQPRFGQGVVGVRRWRVRCGLPTIRGHIDEMRAKATRTRREALCICAGRRQPDYDWAGEITPSLESVCNEILLREGIPGIRIALRRGL